MREPGSSQLLAAEDDAILSALRVGEGRRPRASFRLTRWVYLRALGFCYVVAFAVLYNQALPLIGSQGLLPADLYLARLRSFLSFWQHPTLFWFGISDGGMRACAGAGLALSVLVLAGVDHALIMLALWVVYLSFVHVGQLFYGYGWETLLLEAGSLAVFLAPVRQLRSARDPRPVPAVMHVWLCWLTFGGKTSPTQGPITSAREDQSAFARRLRSSGESLPATVPRTLCMWLCMALV